MTRISHQLVASLAGACDWIRGRSAEVRSHPALVLVRGGTYALREPFVLESQDSGTAEAPVVYAAFKNERPVFPADSPSGAFIRREASGKAVSPK